MAASAEEPVVAGSILECAEKDAETLDWLSIPADQRIFDDKPKCTKLLVVVCLEVCIPSNSWQSQIHEEQFSSVVRFGSGSMFSFFLAFELIISAK